MSNSGKDGSPFSYDRLFHSFRTMGGGLWDYDIEADCLFCNDRWYDILGLSPETASVTSVSHFRACIHPDDVDMATKVDLEHVAGLLARDQRYDVEFRVVRPDGEIRWVRSVACIVRDAADHLRAVGCITDITEFRSQGVEPHQWIGGEEHDPRQAPPPDSAKTPENPLSDRERECLLWVSMGKTAWETACILDRSQRTVEFHLKNAIQKLNAANKIHAVAIAIRQGLL